MALSATADLFSEEDCASKLLPVMCPSLVDKEKMIRDQAQKTVDTYITRIRKYTATMPDTVLPSPSIASASGGNAAPRMSNPANDSTWTGWAISSFTNKLAAASGQMQAGTATTGGSEQRSHSVPPPAVPTASKPTLTPSSRPGMSLTKSAAEIPTISSPDLADGFNDDAEDFDGDWGGFGEDDAFGASNSASKKQEEDDDPWGAPNVTPAPAKNFDDKGEPDFAGWLAAQNQAKTPGTKMLPKGLGKSSTATKKTVVAKTAGAPNVKKVIVAEKKAVKKSEPKKNEDEDEGWGDAW
jgi:SCY1-like protein 1